MSARTLTYYVAASSCAEGVKAAKETAALLDSRGLVCSMAWWEHLGAPADQWPDLARRDIDAARDSDVFVLLTEPPSCGAHVEMGARLAGGRLAWVVGQGGHGLFTRHPLVLRMGHEVLPLLVGAALASVGGGDK